MKVRTAILLAVLAEVAVAALGVNNYGWTIDGLQATTRFSGRLSLFIFSFIFLLYPGNQAILEKYFSGNYFLIFAVAHGIHLIELLNFVYWSGTELVPYRVAGGFLAYLLIFIMPWVKFRLENNKNKRCTVQYFNNCLLLLHLVHFLHDLHCPPKRQFR